MIDVQGLSYRFPDATVDALRDVDWVVERGATVLMVGASGGGKSTLLRSLNGLIPHFHGGWYTGRVQVAGHEVARSSPRDLAPDVGSVFQDPESQMLTDQVVDEIVFTMEQLGYSRQTISQRLEAVIDMLGISPLMGRRISTLSGGERQIVTLASALAHQPPLLILDEPTSQLDDRAAERFITTVNRLRERTGQTAVIAEHRVERILPVADQIVRVERGELTPALRGEISAPLTPAPHSNPSGEQLLELDGVSFSYGETSILDNTNLTASAGEVIALRGLNGSGKTTLFKLIAGLLKPDAGRIVWRGRPIESLPAHERADFLGYVPQHPSSILHQETLAKELDFTCRVQRRRPAMPDILEQLGIGQYREQHPLDLSGGQRQRAAIAAVAVTAPEILLLDEPTRGLSREEQRILIRFVQEYAARGRLVILASHDERVGQAVANRTVTLAHGILQESTIEASTLTRLISG